MPIDLNMSVFNLFFGKSWPMVSLCIFLYDEKDDVPSFGVPSAIFNVRLGVERQLEGVVASPGVSSVVEVRGESILTGI